MKRTDYCRIEREIKSSLNEHSIDCEVDYQRPMSDGTFGLFMIKLFGEWSWHVVNAALRGIMKKEGLDWGDPEADEDVTLVSTWDGPKRYRP